MDSILPFGNSMPALEKGYEADLIYVNDFMYYSPVAFYFRHFDRKGDPLAATIDEEPVVLFGSDVRSVLEGKLDHYDQSVGVVRGVFTFMGCIADAFLIEKGYTRSAVDVPHFVKRYGGEVPLINALGLAFPLPVSTNSAMPVDAIFNKMTELYTKIGSGYVPKGYGDEWEPLFVAASGFDIKMFGFFPYGEEQRFDVRYCKAGMPSIEMVIKTLHDIGELDRKEIKEIGHFRKLPKRIRRNVGNKPLHRVYQSHSISLLPVGYA